jgi:hypothetical protein
LGIQADDTVLDIVDIKFLPILIIE